MALLGACLTSASAPAQPPRAEATPLSHVPLCPGLTIVTAVSQQEGDYESIKTIEAVDAKEVRLRYSSEFMSEDWLATGPPTLKTVVIHRTMLTSDLESAKSYQQTFLEKSADTIPGTTGIGTSTAILKTLKSKGEAELTISNTPPGIEITADRSKRPNYYDYMQMAKLRTTGSARLRVLVNDMPVELPAIHADGESVGDKVEFFFLDDETNPLTLAFRIGIGGIRPLTSDQLKICEMQRKAGASKDAPSTYHFPEGGRCDLPNGGDRDTLRVVKITFRCAAPVGTSARNSSKDAGQLPDAAAIGSNGAKVLERALAESGRADVYSIYFSFNSDVIRDESGPTLKDIAEVLRRHPDWRLAVNGHTDGIGGDQFNLDLSKRRSAAVKDALVKRYTVGAGRLATSGFGKSQPKDTNETLEGRAHNRRVELVRISS